MIDVIGETAKYLSSKSASGCTVGVMGTLSLMKNGLYQDSIGKECPHAQVLILEAEPQAKLDEVIFKLVWDSW